MTFLLYMILAIEDTIDVFQDYNLQQYNITQRALSDFLDILKIYKANHSVANDTFGETSSIGTTPYAPYQIDYTSTSDDVTTDLSIDDASGETSSIGTTPYAPYQNDYTSSSYDVTTDLSIDSNDSTEAKKRFITDTQLEMMMDAVAKVVAIEIHSEKFNSTWEYLNKLNFYNEQIITSVVNYTMDIDHLSGCSRLNNFLNFINHTSDVDMRLFAYNTLFNKISYDLMLSKQTTNWLSLQHFVSHDFSIDSNSQYQNLLTEIESKTNDVLDSPSFDHLNGDYCTSYYWPTQTIYSEYLIKRLCSTDPANIQVLWKIIRDKPLSADAVLQFVKELERNDRLNYTIMALPHIRSKWCTNYYKHNICQQLLDVFPEGSTLRNFLTDRNEFYIKNAYSGEYLCYGSYSYSDLYSSTRSTNIFTCGMKNSTWTFSGKDGFLIASGESSSRNIALDKCEHHNDWYIALKEKYRSSLYGYYENEEFYWELETDNVVNNQFRLKSVKTGGYLRVGQNDDLLISIPECNQSDERKSEWIVERSLYFYKNDDGEIEFSAD